jgi:hypothetical protein
MIFATPDFGASATLWFHLFIVWVIVLILVSIGIIRAIRLLRSESSRARRWGFSLLVVAGLIPFGCCMLPPHAVRITHGNYPLGTYPHGKIKSGMSVDEVVIALGSPHDVFKQGDEECWHYWIDSFGIQWFGVAFGPNGRVTNTYGN